MNKRTPLMLYTEEKVYVNGIEIIDKDSWNKVIDTFKELQQENNKFKNVIDKIKEYCNKQIEIAKENITNSEQWLKVEECHLSAKQDIHTGKLIKRENEKILELLEEVE